eukprot:4407614-Karenia_brevis.AAC.1
MSSTQNLNVEAGPKGGGAGPNVTSSNKKQIAQLRQLLKQTQQLDSPPSELLNSLKEAIAVTQQAIYAEKPVPEQLLAIESGIARRESKLLQHENA